ncbi:MAG: hypothetical protein ACLQU3_18095 [Limisphaerales bacterium]
MLLLIAGVQIGIIRFPIAHHAEQNFEPALAQTANGTGMAVLLKNSVLVERQRLVET